MVIALILFRPESSRNIGLSRVEELEAKCSELEKLYHEAVTARDEAIEERNSATVVIALQLEKETHELNLKIEELTEANDKLLDENEDLDIKLEYARKDLKKLQKAHIKLQLETESYITEREEAIQQVKQLQEERSEDLQNKTAKTTDETFDEKNNNKTSSNSRSCDKSKTENVTTNEHSNDDKSATASVKKGGIIDMDKGRRNQTIDEDELEPRPPIKLKTSSVENDYDVHEELGKGKFGVVKKVTDKSKGDVFAAKYIKTSATAAGSSRDDILKEIDIMGRLHHKRLVGLLDAYDAGKTIVMIMEFISGGELFERVADEDCLTEKEAAYYMHQILQGLQHMHNKSILHLDLKPENIVCVSKSSWDIKLIDFGLAMELVPGTKLKGMKGTPEFMAPEAINFDTISKSSDMWSIGVIAYILLSGLSPFMGDDNNETLSNVVEGEWDFDDESFDVISDEAKEFISQLLIKNPTKRNTVEDCLKHNWMKKSASSDAVKIDTKKLKQFLAKRRWQKTSDNDQSGNEKSVNALVAVRRLSSMVSLLGLNKARPSIAPLLAVVPASNETSEDEEEDTNNKNINGTDKKDERTKVNGSGKPDGSKSVEIKNNCEKEDKQQQKEEKQQEKKESVQEKKETAKKPVFTKELEDFTLHEGDSVTMEVVVDGSPGCEIEWFFDGGEVNEVVSIEDHGNGRHTLVINECEEDDAGEYICMAVNDHGKARSRGFLIVEVDPESGPDIDPPSFTKELVDMTTKEGETITMEVAVTGEEYDLEWFKNAVDVVEGGRFSFITKGDGKHALVITDVEDDDTGEYCCVAANDGGRTTCAGYFTVEVEEEDEEEGESEDETDEEMYQEKNIRMKNEFIEDSYAIEEEIGRGRFGIVRKCVHIQTGIHFVAKSIKARPSQKEEFSREIDVLNVLRHPNISRMRDAFERPREIVIVMEFNRGGDLLKRINEQPMSEPDTVAIMQQLLEAVNYIHENSYMHLDVKPENVMFKRDGGNTVKLIDFSLTRKYDPKKETKISQGTAEYIAPEIVNYDCVTPATDMWAVGVCTYMMLSGKSPFLGDTEADTFTNITHCRWSFTDVFNDVSNEAKDYVTRLLVKQKTERMKASECLKHPWITTIGVRGSKDRLMRPTLSSSRSLSDMSSSLLNNGDIHESISSVESYLRVNSSSDDVFTEEADQRQSVDAKELEATLQIFMLKLRDVESERAELEEKLKTEENRAVTLQHNKGTLDEKISNLEKENTTLSSQIKSKNELLIKVGDLETKAKRLEEELEDKKKTQKTLEERCANLRTKLEHYDFLEEKLFGYEREKKDNLRKIQALEEKLDEQKHLEKNLENKNVENEKEKSTKIDELITEKESIESKYNKLRQEKETLVSELTKKFTIMESQRKESQDNADSSENKVKDLEKELQKKVDDLSESNKKLERSSKEIEKLKQRTSKELESKVTSLDEQKLELEKEGNKLKKQKEEAQKTCEELASKLSKAYGEMEKLKSSSILARDYDKLRRERDELKRNVSSLEEKNAKLSRDLKSRDAQISDLKKDLEMAEKEKKTIQERRKMSQINTETNFESLKSTILDLESTILTHKSSVAVSKGEIELLQEKLSLEEEKNARIKEELLDKKRVIAKLKTEKAEVISQYEDELDEALDCYEESKKELITKFEKRLKDFEHEYNSESHQPTEEIAKFNEEEAIRFVKISLESLKQLSSLEENNDSFESDLLDTVKNQIELMVKKVNNNIEIEGLQTVFQDLDNVIEKRTQERKQMDEKLENTTKERELITLRVNKMKKKYHDQSDTLLDAKHNIEILESKIMETKDKVTKCEELEEENKVLKWRVNELNSMKQKLDEKIVDEQGEMLILERKLKHYTEKLKTLKQLEEQNASLKLEVNKLEKANKTQKNELERESEKQIRKIESKLEQTEMALKSSENKNERLNKDKLKAIKQLEEEKNNLKLEVIKRRKNNNDLRDKLTEAEKQIKVVKSQLEQTKEELKNSDDEYERLCKKNQSQKEKLRSVKENLKTLEQMLEGKSEAYERLHKETNDFKKNFDNTLTQHKEQLTNCAQEIDTLRKEKKELIETSEKLDKEKEELNLKLNQLCKEMEDKDEELTRTESEVEKLKNNIKDQYKSFEKLKSDIGNMKEELDEGSRLKAQNETLKMKEEQRCKLVDCLKTKKGELESEISVLRKVSREQEKVIVGSKIEVDAVEKELEDTVDSHGKLQLNIKQLTFKIDELETLYRDKSNQHDKLEIELESLRNKNVESERISDDIDMENKQMKLTLDKLNKTIKELKEKLSEKDQQFENLKEQDDVKSERLTKMVHDNKDLLAESIENNKLIEGQRIKLSEAAEEIEKLQRQIEDFEVQKQNGLALYEELRQLYDEKDNRLKNFEDTKGEMSSLEEKCDTMKMELIKVKGDLNRKTDDLGILNEENMCLNKDVENLRKERLEGYQMLSQLEKRHFQLKEDLRQARQALRIYKTEVKRQTEEIKQKDNDIHKLSCEKSTSIDEEENEHGSLESLDDPFDSPGPKLCKIHEIEDISDSNKVIVGIEIGVQTDEQLYGKHVVDGAVQTEGIDEEKQIVIDNAAQTEEHVDVGVEFKLQTDLLSEKHDGDNSVQTEGIHGEKHFGIDNAAQTEEIHVVDKEVQSNEPSKKEHAVQTVEHPSEIYVLLDKVVQTDEHPVVVNEVQTVDQQRNKHGMDKDVQTDNQSDEKYMVESAMQTVEHSSERQLIDTDVQTDEKHVADKDIQTHEQSNKTPMDDNATQTKCQTRVERSMQTEREHVGDNVTQTEEQSSKIQQYKEVQTQNADYAGQKAILPTNSSGNLEEVVIQTDELVCTDAESSATEPAYEAADINITPPNHSQGSDIIIQEEAFTVQSEVCNEAMFFETNEIRSIDDTLKLLEEEQQRSKILESQVSKLEKENVAKETEVKRLQEASKYCKKEQERCEILEAQVKKLENNIKMKQVDVQKFEKTLMEYEEEKERCGKLATQIEELKSSIELKEAEVYKLEKEMQCLKDRIEEATTSLNNAEQKYNVLYENCSSLQTTIDTHSNALQNLKVENNFINEKLVTSEGKCAELQNRCEAATKQLNEERRKTMNNMETQTSSVELEAKHQQTQMLVLEQKSTQPDHEEGVIIDLVPGLKHDLSRLSSLNEQLEGELTYEQNRNDYLEERRMKLQGELARLQQEMKCGSVEITQLQEENNYLKNQMELSSSNQEKQAIESLNQEITRLQEENNDFKNELAAEKSKLELSQSSCDSDQDCKIQVELLESRLQAIKHRLVTCVLEPMVEAKVYKIEQDVCIEKFATWEKIKEDLTEALQERGRLTSEKQSLVLAWKRLNIDYLQMTRQLKNTESPTTEQTVLTSTVATEGENTSTELVIEKLKTIKKKFQDMKAGTMVDAQLVREFQELRQEQEEMRKEIKEDTKQVHLLKEQNQELFSRVGDILRPVSSNWSEKQGFQNMFGETSTHTEGMLEFNFNFGATLRSSFQSNSYENPSNPNANFTQTKFYRNNEDSACARAAYDEEELLETDSNNLPCLGECQQVLAEMSDEFENELKEVMVELVRTNRNVYEMGKEIDCLNSKLKSKVLDSKSEKSKEEENSKETENIKIENKRLTEQNGELHRVIKENTSNKETQQNEITQLEKEKQDLEKEIEKMKESHQTNLQELERLTESVNQITKQKEELSVGIVLRDKKIALYEKELKEGHNRKTQNGDKSDGNIENGIEDDEPLDDQLRDELREAQHKAALLEAELEQLRANTKIQQDEMENKWAKRLRKECSELQAELAEKSAQEKRTWLKKEADLQNMIRQMKVLLDKRAKEVQVLKKKLEKNQEIKKTSPVKTDLDNSSSPTKETQEQDQKSENTTELSTSKNSDIASTASLDSSSMSDDMVDAGSLNAGETDNTKANSRKDGLSDRDLRRVAYKLTSEEWTQLGSFLGVSDSELQSLVSLSMGPQEKAFRLLCLWNSRSTLGKNQLVSQLAIALEEINRKDVALFVVEQMMTGKPRKKFFGWRK